MPVNSKSYRIFLSIGAVFALGTFANLWQREKIEGASSSVVGSSGFEGLNSSVGQGVSLAVLGGYRSIAANVIWLELNGSWERQEIDETVTKIELATSTDPRVSYFWVNGARIIANDIPVWAATSQGITRESHPDTMAAINRKFGSKALDLIDRALLSHPQNLDLMVDRAVIYWKKMEDLDKAAELFLEIANLSDGPYFAGRLYAELSVNLGRSAEALEYLKSIYLGLPDDDPQAMKPFVADRIRTLEIALEQ